ncbi:hypothetical protein [Paludisphaera rhizosphaerae]|uniref:hypothetical protein n=1 Tax=Paludisphaera rhizosphaerae TaxID=2711216 RepID=UPI0013ED46C7|nr:hypothetical protein [Paludisphaera rhizosphaerae]
MIHRYPSLPTGLLGAATIAAGQISQEAAATWLGIALLAWSAVLAAYDRLQASRRANARADLEARLSGLQSEAEALEARIGGLRSELSGLQIQRNQIAVEEGR